MKQLLYLCFVLAALVFSISSCKEKITAERLIGTWNYVKVEGIRNQEESLTDEEVAAEAPSITFAQDGELLIVWNKEVLSKGRFTIEGEIIRYIESLPNGVKRPIPFLVKQLSENSLVFETMEEQATRITATKAN